MEEDQDYSLSRPLPSVTLADNVRLLSSRDMPGTSSMEPTSYYRGRHSRYNSEDARLRPVDESEIMPDDAFEVVEHPSSSKARRLSPHASSASSVLRRLTTKYSSMKRSQSRQYATLNDGNADQAAAVDISTLEGMGWELTDLSNGSASRQQHEQTEYVPPNRVGGKPDFRRFVENQSSLGDGMRNVGVHLRRDPTKIGRGPAGLRHGVNSAVERSKTVKEFGQNLAHEKNMIVEVEEAVDLSSLEGGGHSDNRASQTFESMEMREETKSYFFPEDPDIPNWKPRSMSSVYILALLVIALGLAGLQEYLCQRSLKSVREKSGILEFDQVADISTWDFFAWKYLPTMVTIIYAVLFSIMDFDIRRLEPFYQLSRRGGSSAAGSLNLDHLTMFQYFIPFKAFRLKQWAVLVSSLGNIVASMAAPALQNPSVVFITNPNPLCNDATGCPGTGEKHFWVRISPVWSRLLSASYVVIAIITLILFIQLRRKSGLLSDPKGIAGIASMATKSHILQDFAGLDTANCGNIHKRIQHRHYVLFKSSIWQGEWSAASEPAPDSEKKLTSPHPIMLRTEAAIPFLLFMLLCLVSVVVITVTPARIVPNAVPWLPVVVATLLKLLFSTFEADVRLMEPFYQLSRGNAKPENSLTLDYQSTVYGIMPFKAAIKGHYLVALVGVASVALDILTVTVSSFSVNSEDFMRIGDTMKDRSNGDETFVSFWASLGLSMLILVFVMLTTALVYLRRGHPFLPREPTTIAAVLAFIYASKMLTDFIDTERLNNRAMEIRLKTIDKRYGLGWVRGRDGEIHCAIDEEPMRSKYVHGKPYTMAQAAPLQPHETFYAI